MKQSRYNNGISSTNKLIIIIIIGVLFFQFALPMIDNKIPSLTDAIQTGNKPIYIDWGILNANTTEFINAGIGAIAYYETGNVFKMVIKSNVPYKILEPYYVSIHILESSILIGGIYEKIGFNAIYSNEFTYNLNLDTSQTLHYEIQLTIYDFNENPVENSFYNMFIFDKV